MLIDSRVFRKTVVSFAYCVILLSLNPTVMPSILGFYLIASARNSIPRTKSMPYNGQPCLMPRSRLKSQRQNHCFCYNMR